MDDDYLTIYQEVTIAETVVAECWKERVYIVDNFFWGIFRLLCPEGFIVAADGKQEPAMHKHSERNSL